MKPPLPRNYPTRIDANDRMMLSLMTVTVMIVTSALLNIPLLGALVVSAALVGVIQIYGRRPQAGYAERALEAAKRTREANQFGERAITQAIDDGIWVIDPMNRIIFANHAAEAMFGTIQPGQHLTTMIRTPAIGDLARKGLAGETPPPVSYDRDMPTEMHLRVYAHPLQPYASQDPSARHVMLIFRDETDAQKFATMQGDFLANASHELKTPIASLLGYIETLRGHAKDDPKAQEKFLGIMQEQAERMQRLINDLLSLRHIEQQEHIAPTQAANLSASLGQAVDVVRPIAKKRRVTFSIDELNDAIVVGHQDELVQLCLNLIDNAVRMSPEGSTLRITLTKMENWRQQSLLTKKSEGAVQTRLIIPPPETERPYIALSIADEGPGFHKDHLPRIGERFYRVAGDRASREKGTGLGLAIVKHVVMRHRGGLHVKTRANAEIGPTGTVFTALIPAAPSTPS